MRGKAATVPQDCPGDAQRLPPDMRILVHHSGKSGVTYRGSSKLATTFEIVIGLTVPEGHHVSDGAAFALEWTKWRRQSCAAVRDRLVRLATLADGKREWTAEAAPNDDARLLAATARECVHASQDDFGVALGWSKSKVSKVKGKMFTLGLMDKDEFETCLEEARGAANSDY